MPQLRRSATAKMLYSSSNAGATLIYRRVHVVAIISSVVLYALSTMESVSDDSMPFYLAEGAISLVFAGDYALRIYSCRENRRYSKFGFWESRLRWAVSWQALLDATSFVPFFIDQLVTPSDRSLPVLGWVRVLRIFHLFNTSKWAGAVRTVGRVLFVNREILYTSLALVSITIIITSILLHLACAENERQCAAEHGITNLPSAMYVASMMLTGQASPEGQLPLSLRVVVMLTAFLSVPFFAVPAAMLTWGFEGEAQRLAAREKRRAARRQAYSSKSAYARDGTDMAELLSGSSSDEAYEDYLEGLGGGESDEDEKEAMEEQAIAFFRDSHATASTGAEPATEGKLLFRARALASALWEREREASRRRQQRRDALELLQKLRSSFSDGMSKDDADAMEARLQAFMRAVGPAAAETAPRGETIAADSGKATAASRGEPRLEARLDAMQQEIAELRKTVLALGTDIKTLIKK